MKLTGMILAAMIFLSGCTGIITGYEYDVVKVYKVAKKGVITFMTEEEIKDAGLDKAAFGVEYAYSVIKEGNGAE